MKAFFSAQGIGRLLVLFLAVSSVSCVTTYDRSGRPVQTVDPGAAAVGVVAAGVIGYALANDDDDKKRYGHHGHYNRPYYGQRRGYHCR